MRLHEKAIPYLGTVGSFVVTGGADGLVSLGCQQQRTAEANGLMRYLM